MHDLQPEARLVSSPLDEMAETLRPCLHDLIEHQAHVRLEKVQQQRLEMSAHEWALSEGLRKVREARLVSPEAEARALQELAKLV